MMHRLAESRLLLLLFVPAGLHDINFVLLTTPMPLIRVQKLMLPRSDASARPVERESLDARLRVTL